MKIRLTVALNVSRRRPDVLAERETQLDSLVEHGDDAGDYPGIGFRSTVTEDRA